MPLSLHKLEKLLGQKNLIPKKFFVIHDLCVYIEVISLTSSENFMLYIPSKYDIVVKNTDGVYNIKSIEITEEGNISTDYAGDPDNFDLDTQYNTDINISDELNNGEHMETHMYEKYNHQVSLKDTSKKDTSEVREIFRQLRRLKFCVQNLKYKICISYKNYLCCIRRDNTFDCYKIQKFTGSLERKLTITLDLESLYEKIDSIVTDVKIIKDCLYTILDKNQINHVKNLQKILDLKNNIHTFSDNVLAKKNKYSSYLNHLESLLKNLCITETNIINKISSIHEKYESNTTLHSDIEKSHQLGKYEVDLKNIAVTKQEIMSSIAILKSKYENLSLAIDIICFDNIIMIDAILKNFILLAEY